MVAARILLPILTLLALAGYWAPWVNHKAVALILTGLDLGEFVKFLPEVRAGEVRLMREVFYLPLFWGSCVLTLLALAAKGRSYSSALRAGMLLLAWAMALAMLPPVWTPQTLLSPEFRKQTAAIVFCLALPGLFPLLGRLPFRAAAAAGGVLAVPTLMLPALAFKAVLPCIARLYGHPVTPGWGFWLMEAGLLGFIGLAAAGASSRR